MENVKDIVDASAMKAGIKPFDINGPPEEDYMTFPGLIKLPVDGTFVREGQVRDITGKKTASSIESYFNSDTLKKMSGFEQLSGSPVYIRATIENPAYAFTVQLIKEHKLKRVECLYFREDDIPHLEGGEEYANMITAYLMHGAEDIEIETDFAAKLLEYKSRKIGKLKELSEYDVDESKAYNAIAVIEPTLVLPICFFKNMSMGLANSIVKAVISTN